MGRLISRFVGDFEDVRGLNRIQWLSIQPYKTQPFFHEQKSGTEEQKRGEVKVHISRFLLVRHFSETEPRASSD
jgi:hypothetical protein